MVSLRNTHDSCGLCGQAIDGERAALDAMDTVLFGAAQYASCLFCRRVVPKPWTKTYRERWDSAFAEQVLAAQRVRPDDDSAQIGPALRNSQGTRCHFRLLLAGSGYVLKLHIAEQVVEIGTFSDLAAAMQGWRAFEQRLCGSGFWRLQPNTAALT